MDCEPYKDKTKVWKVQGESLLKMPFKELNLEKRIHIWVEEDLSIILPNG